MCTCGKSPRQAKKGGEDTTGSACPPPAVRGRYLPILGQDHEISDRGADSPEEHGPCVPPSIACTCRSPLPRPAVHADLTEACGGEFPSPNYLSPALRTGEWFTGYSKLRPAARRRTSCSQPAARSNDRPSTPAGGFADHPDSTTPADPRHPSTSLRVPGSLR